jgi:hypothetical protein
MTIVDSLLGHAQVELAIECLGSLRTCSQEPVRLRLRDDGTLDSADRDRLMVLGEPEVVDRATADERIEPLLSRHPACMAYRRRHPLGIKLFDLGFETGAVANYCDTDVLFLRPFAGLFAELPGNQVWCMRDSQNAYSIRSWHLVRHRLRFPARLNAGLLRFPRARFDIDRVEWYLNRREMAIAPFWQEQTSWAMLSGALDCRYIEPYRFFIALGPPAGERCRNATAVHLVTPARRFLADWRALRSEIAFAPITTAPSRRLSAARLLAEEVGRRLRRLRAPG